MHSEYKIISECISEKNGICGYDGIYIFEDISN